MKQRVIALGFFDGVHLGHAALLRRTTDEARKRGCSAAVFTFDRLPREVVTGIPCPLINSPEDRREIMQRLYGVDEVLMVPFDADMMNTEWDAFVTELLVKQYHAVHLVVGEDHRFGRKNGGSAEKLRELCAQLDLGFDAIPEVHLDGTPVRSTHIRALVEQGLVEEAMEFLGHPHQLTETVQHGNHIGRTIGVPTINLRMPSHVLVPAHGVYATRVTLEDGSCYTAVTNVGLRPTVDDGRGITVESWLLDFDGDLYGQSVRVQFFTRLRGEVRFDSLDALKQQIDQDAAAARNYFAKYSLIHR